MRYRYYVSGSLITKDRTDKTPAALRISGRGDRTACKRIGCTDGFLDPGSIDKSSCGAWFADPSIQHRRVRGGPQEIGKHWPEFAPLARKSGGPSSPR